MKVIWTREALSRLQEIEDYISPDDPIKAGSFVDSIIQKSVSLSVHSERGRIVPELQLPTEREIIYKNYRIVYRTDKKRVVILTVFECHKLMDVKKRFS